MKLTIRIPGEMYSFDEVELEVPTTTQAPQVLKEWADQVRAEFAPRPVNELPPKEWDTFIEKLLLGENNHTETLEKMSPAQKQTYNVIKRATARINSKSRREPLASEYDLPGHLADGGQSD